MIRLCCTRARTSSPKDQAPLSSRSDSGRRHPPIDYTAHLRCEMDSPDRGTFMWTASDKLNEKIVVTVARGRLTRYREFTKETSFVDEYTWQIHAAHLSYCSFWMTVMKTILALNDRRHRRSEQGLAGGASARAA